MFHVALDFVFFVNLSHTMQNGPMFHVEHFIFIAGCTLRRCL